MKIGVFDSGIGGLSVANAVKRAMPEHQIIFKNDAIHVPYGTKSMDEVLAFTLPVLQELVDEGVACIVVACNTVSTNLIEPLRKLIAVPLIAMEPMVKPAAEQTTTGIIAVCATPATLHSERYAWLKSTYAPTAKIIEPDCTEWAQMIENNSVDQAKIATTITQVLDQGADIIVLGCTHYHWIETEIKQIAVGKATVLQPEQPVIAQVTRVLEQLS